MHVFDMIPLEKAYRLKEFSNNKNLIYTKGDLRSKSQIKSWYQNDASHLYHLASVVGVQNYMSDPLALIDIVVGGSRNLFELAASNNTRIIFTSTSEVYGKNPNTPWEESFDRVLGPTSIDRWSYSSSKAVCEHMLFAFKKSHDLNFTILRFLTFMGLHKLLYLLFLNQSTISLIKKLRFSTIVGNRRDASLLLKML